ncbi:MAG: hypothetical protein DRN71_04495 [Candidatus Nanohalarchaeota archaeon]|nr:MAG: hypothetical protein DRN71_04495 [Candidatus Nanohaloarchaeota archaeon]
MKQVNLSIDALTQKILKTSNLPLSTYQIAKQAKISWSTANIHCYKLKSEGKIDGKMEKAEVGSGKKMVWWIGKK